MVMVEQNAFAALQLCDRGYLLAQGRVAMTSTSAELLDNPPVKSARLGIGEPAQDLVSKGGRS